MDEEDFDIDDILGNLNKKQSRKKNTSKKKGNRGENALCDVLEARFPGSNFARVLGSGNRGKQVTLSEEIRGAFTGDIMCPSNFKWVVECKYGYQDHEFMGFFEGGHKLVDEWMVKAQREGDYIHKQPILCWRKPRQPWLAFLPEKLIKGLKFDYKMCYRDWSFVLLTKLLEQPDSYWFQ